MTVKSQIVACRDSLMAGMRAAARGAAPDVKAEKLLRACLDLVEHLERQSLAVTQAEVSTTLNVFEQAKLELEEKPDTSNAVLVALKNAIERLQGLLMEIRAAK